MYKEQLAAYTEVLFKQMFSRELSKALSWSSPMNKPTAILLAGQPGAGKTQLSAYFFRQSKNKNHPANDSTDQKWSQMSKHKHLY